MTLLSAADWHYWRCLYQLLLSAERRQLTARHRFVVFDLGLGAQRRVLEARFAWCEFRSFDLGRYPAHLARPLRQNGWKPLVIEESMRRDGGLLLWLDSATILRAPLEPVAQEIRRAGVYSLKGQTPLAGRCDPSILDALAVPPGLRRRVERVSGVLGLDCDAPAVGRLVQRWRELSLVPEYLGTRSASHRCEQALLSIILYDMEAKGELRLGTEEIDVSSASPIGWMSSRNKVAPGMPLWADPLVRGYYASYKAIDQALWRLRRRRVQPARAVA